MKRVRKALALLMALAMSLALAIPALAGSKPGFKDVAEDAYYYSAVEWAWLRDITKGTSETTFEPDAACTRGQVATFLWRANEKPEPTIKRNPFTDVKTSSPFYKAILWAYENNITTGTSKTTFSPNHPCTRAHVLTFLWRSLGKPEAPYSELADYRLPQGYWTDAFRWADSKQLLSVSDVSPENPCPRADIVYYLYKGMPRYETNGGFPIPEGTAFGLSGEDAALYSAAAKVLCEDFQSEGDLLLPSLSVYGQYDGSDGSKNYVCGLLRLYYYDLDIGNSENIPENKAGGAGNLARITVKNGVCTAIETTYDGDTAEGRASRIRELCGPLTNLAKRLIDGSAQERRLTTDNYQDLLSAYTKYYF